MSSDNYNVVRKNPATGKYVVIMAFASAYEDSDEMAFDVPIGENKFRWEFNTLREAIDFANEDYTEYGVIVHPECLADIQ